MKKWMIVCLMAWMGSATMQAQIVLPTKKKATTETPMESTVKKEKKKKGKAADSALPSLPTSKKSSKSDTQTPASSTVKTTSTAHPGVLPTLPTTAKPVSMETTAEKPHPGVLPTLPTTTAKPVEATTEKKEVARVTVKRRVAPRAKPIKRKPAVEDNEIYESAEHMPTYPGGVSALMEFIKSNMQYPEDALAERAEGIVQVSFVVEKDGSTTEFEVLDEHHPALEAEAVRILQQMPKWTPATQDGVKVRVEYTVPVKFIAPEQAKEDDNVNANDNPVQD